MTIAAQYLICVAYFVLCSRATITQKKNNFYGRQEMSGNNSFRVLNNGQTSVPLSRLWKTQIFCRNSVFFCALDGRLSDPPSSLAVSYGGGSWWQLLVIKELNIFGHFVHFAEMQGRMIVLLPHLLLRISMFRINSIFFQLDHVPRVFWLFWLYLLCINDNWTRFIIN